MKSPKYYVDARRSVPFDSLEAAREYAQQNPPAVVLERRESHGRVQYVEATRFDWHWDADAGAPTLGFC